MVIILSLLLQIADLQAMTAPITSAKGSVVQAVQPTNQELRAATDAMQAGAAALKSSAEVLKAEASKPQGTPPAVWATLGAAILALLASLNSTRIARKTAREVAELSTQTTRDTASIASQTAKELKERDYRDDFYKKLIAKRIIIWDKSEEIIHLLSDAVSDLSDNGAPMHSCFKSPKDFDDMANKMKNLQTLNLWMSAVYALQFHAIEVKMGIIADECTIKGVKDTNGMRMLDGKLLRNNGKKHFAELDKMINELIISSRDTLVNLHDIDAFIKGTAGVGLNREFGKVKVEE